MNIGLFTRLRADQLRPGGHAGADRHAHHGHRRTRVFARRLTTVGNDPGQRPAADGDRVRADMGCRPRGHSVWNARWAAPPYLIWLGVQAWRHAGSEREAEPPGRHVHFIRGTLVAVSNPKTIAFFTASCRSSSIPPARRAATGGDVLRHRAAGGDDRYQLGGGLGPRPRVVHAAGSRQIARPPVRKCADRRRDRLSLARHPG